MPDNREWVDIGMVAVGLAIMVALPFGRSSLAGILRVALGHSLVVAFVVLASWMAFIVWCGWRLSIWDASLTTTTVFAFITTGGVLFGKAASGAAVTGAGFFRRTVFATVGAAAILGAYITITPLPLWAEAILGITLLAVGVLLAFTRTQSGYAGCATALAALAVVVVLGEVTYVSVSLGINWSTTDWRSLLEGVLLPVWLTVGLLPVIYLLAMFSVFQSAVTRVALTRLNDAALSRVQRGRIWAALVLGLRTNTAVVRAFNYPWTARLAETRSLTDALKVVRAACESIGRRNSP
jgi:hypothetical protein